MTDFKYISEEIEKQILTEQINIGAKAEAIADDLEITKDKLTILLREEGTTLTQIKENCKLRLSKILLQDPEFTVEGVARELAFCTRNSLDRLFIRREGMSAAQYREKKYKIKGVRDSYGDAA